MLAYTFYANGFSYRLFSLSITVVGLRVVFTDCKPFSVISPIIDIVRFLCLWGAELAYLLNAQLLTDTGTMLLAVVWVAMCPTLVGRTLV